MNKTNEPKFYLSAERGGLMCSENQSKWLLCKEFILSPRLLFFWILDFLIPPEI